MTPMSTAICRMLDEMRQRTRYPLHRHHAQSGHDEPDGSPIWRDDARKRRVSKLVSVDLDTAEELVAAE